MPNLKPLTQRLRGRPLEELTPPRAEASHPPGFMFMHTPYIAGATHRLAQLVKRHTNKHTYIYADMDVRGYLCP